jgi:hypothetical protein
MMKKYKSKSKRKSGIDDKPSDEVVKKQLWPQSKLQYEYAGSKISFEDLEFNLFVAGGLNYQSYYYYYYYMYYQYQYH